MSLLIQRGAVFDDTRLYRYELYRLWKRTLPRCCFIMLNPSLADEARDDPTIRKCVDLARSWGYGSLVCVNLFAYRSVNPAALTMVGDPVGPKNDLTITRAVTGSAGVVAAWGDHGRILDRNRQIVTLIDRCGVSLWCLGTTLRGNPRHPLYVPRSRKLQRLSSE